MRKRWKTYMTTLNYTADYPIDARGFRLEGMAFDGCHYYFSVFCDNIILKYDSDLEMIRKIETSRRYSRICYDYKEKCFWACSKDHYGCIFKLNCRFTEIDRIDLGYDLCGVISGLSYHCGDDSLLIAVADRVVKLTKYNRKLQVVCTFPKCYVAGVLSLSPGIIITLFENGHQYMYIIEEGKKQGRALSAPPCFLIDSMIIQPCSSGDSINLSVLATKRGCYPYILTVKLCPLFTGIQA